MSGFITNQSKRKGYFTQDKHARERLDYDLPDIGHLIVSEWAFCTTNQTVNIEHPLSQKQPDQVVGQPIYGGNRWVQVKFAYQVQQGGRDAAGQFTADDYGNLNNDADPCVRSIMPLNILWSPYIRRSAVNTLKDSKYTGFTERIWPLGMESLFDRYKYIRVKSCKVTIQFTNWSKDAFAGYVAVNRRDVDFNGVGINNLGSDTEPGYPPRGMYNTISFSVPGAKNSTSFNAADPDTYQANVAQYAKPAVSYFEFEVNIPRLCADLEWKYDAMQQENMQSNFWYDLDSTVNPAYPRPAVECYYQIFLNRKYHGEDATPTTGPMVAIRHTWAVEVGRNDASDGTTSTVRYLTRTT